MELKNLENEKRKLLEKLHYLKSKVKNYKNLLNRSECPCCEQKIDYKIFETKIPDLESNIFNIDKRLDEIIPILRKMYHKIACENEKKHKERRKQIEEYLKINRNKLNKAIRDYNKGLDPYLPEIPEKEKELWNDAMEHHLDNRNLDENEELCFN